MNFGQNEPPHLCKIQTKDTYLHTDYSLCFLRLKAICKPFHQRYFFPSLLYTEYLYCLQPAELELHQFPFYRFIPTIFQVCPLHPTPISPSPEHYTLLTQLSINTVFKFTLMPTDVWPNPSVCLKGWRPFILLGALL